MKAQLVGKRVPEGSRRSASDALHAMMHRYTLRLPLDRRVEYLSGGQRVLVAVMRGLLTPNARLFVLDEVYEGLSDEVRAAVTRMIRDVAQVRPVLMTSHRIEDLTALDARCLALVAVD